MYKDMYAGPVYSLHYVVSLSNIMVFTSIIFGPIIPVFYIFAIVFLILQYVFDAITLAYIY